MRTRRTTDAAPVGTTRRALPGSVRWADARPAGTSPALVRISALGPLEAVVGDCPVDLGTPKQRALLALLVSRVGQPVAVDVMLEALWAGHPPPSAMTSLQAYVANLRKVLEPDRAPRTPAKVLRTCTQGYVLDDREVDVDVHRFGEHATAGWQAMARHDSRQALGEFEAGLALWRGRPYSEVAGATWVAPEVARLDELRLSVVEARCAALLAVGAHEVAVAELEAFVQAHPLREYGCELLTLALYRAGRQADALTVLRTIQSRLAEELGVDPRPALKQLEHEILNQSPSLDWQPAQTTSTTPTPATPTLTTATATPPATAATPASTPTSAPVAQKPATPTIPATRVEGGAAVVPQVRVTGAPPTPAPDGEVFVGREAELRQLADALAAATAGRRRVVTVCGEPEIGKTSLLRRFADRVGAPVLWGTGPEHVDAPPLWLWEQVLRGAATCFPHVPVPAAVAELLDEDRRRGDDPGSDLRRFEAVVRYLGEVSDTVPLVVLLDHVHRADPGSLRLLAHLAESAPTSRLLLVVAYRSDEAAALAGTLAALARADVTRIRLTGLDVHETRTLASTVLRREVGGHTAQALWSRSEGNPFFLRELIKLSAADQGLDEPHPVPTPVREVVSRRVARLPRGTAELLSVAAVAGRHFDVEIVAQAASVEVEEALESLDRAIEAGLVVEDDQRLGWFRFTHALAAETLYETTGRMRRALVRRRIGAAAARVWTGGGETAAGIARHRPPAAQLDATTGPARVAEATLPGDAARLWRQALAAADLAEQEDLDRHSLLIGLGASLYRAENFRDGLRVFTRAMEEILSAPGTPDTARLVATAVAAVSELDLCPDGRGEVDDRLVGVIERALPHVVDPAQRGRLLACLAVARRHDEDPAGRAAMSDEALALAGASTGNAESATLLHLRAVALSGPDHLDQRLRAVAELLALPDLPPLAQARARRLRAQALVVLGRVHEAAAELELAAEHAESPSLRTRLGWARAGLLLLDGRWAEADEVSRTTYDRCARASWDDARFNRVLQRWEAAHLTGGGQHLVDELRSAAESSGRPALQAILVMALVDAGLARDARIALHRFPRGPEEDHLWLYARCWALLAAARLGETDLVARWRAQLLPYRHLACSAPDLVVSGPVAYFTAEAALALGDPDAALADLAVATDVARRMGALPWLARVRDAVEPAHRFEAAPCG
ncbi:AAA family ATPase [Saccharothrix sp. S26]|uniref:AfsR/SARP family transcriptional regulator n=1 Tax=Saccharothrix sp. S26 TaxID=2907215 RepID=UPI001F427D48|nr:AfsR/SARP family transcriptional regulator [Saccharothrix sp. S26]MCE7000939.1 AAA family ATPase [Saccharothrix sp. S26]